MSRVWVGRGLGLSLKLEGYMFGSARGVYWYQVHAWSSWVQDSVGSPLLAHYLVSFQPMEANSLQSYYLSIFMRIKGTGPCGWTKEWMNEWIFFVKHDETNDFFLDVLGLKSFFCWLLLFPKSLGVHPFSRDLTELRTDITSSAPCIDLKDCLFSLSDFESKFAQQLLKYIEIIQNHWVSDDVVISRILNIAFIPLRTPIVRLGLRDSAVGQIPGDT